MKLLHSGILHSGDIEVILAHHFNPRINIIVPNISWGLGFMHEIDLLLVRPSHWATEIEIKISLSDIKADKKKRHDHRSDRIRELYFAVPLKLKEQALDLINERAGLIVICVDPESGPYAEIVRSAKINKSARKLDDNEIRKLCELAAMRLWSLKKRMHELSREIRELRSINHTE